MMLLAWDNKADAATLATDSQQASLPATNVQDPRISRKWQTATGVKSAYLLLDLGSSLSCSLLALLGTNLSSSGTVRLRGSVTDATATGSLAYDSGTVSAGAVSGYGAVYKSFAATASRYWRIDIADSTVADNLQVGRVFLGPSWQPAIGMALGVAWTDMDPSRRSKSRGGQVYVEQLAHQRAVEFTLDFQTEAEMFGQAWAMARAIGVAGDAAFIEDPSGTYLSQKAVWGQVAASEPVVNDRLGIFRQKFRIEERL